MTPRTRKYMKGRKYKKWLCKPGRIYWVTTPDGLTTYGIRRQLKTP